MNILKNKLLLPKNNSIKFEKKEGKLFITNSSDFESTVIIPKVYKTQNSFLEIEFNGNMLYGEKCGALAKLVSKSGKAFLDIPLNSKIYAPKMANFFMVALRIMPKTKLEITNLTIDYTNTCDSKIIENLTGDTVVIVPGYPSNMQKYNFSFVHSKVRQYQKLGWNIDILAVTGSEVSSKYVFENINVTTTNYLNARNILQKNKYKRIIVHFFTSEYANLLDAIDTTDSQIYIYSHGSDLIYRDYNIMTAKYFEQPKDLTAAQEIFYKEKDAIIQKYNNMANVKWIFGTNWAKNRAETLNNIKFNNYSIIPCIIDGTIFKFNQKKPEDRTKIFTIKKFDDVNTYSVDILVRTILELSKRSFFNKLEFNIYGDGTEHDRLLKPISNFKNVNIYKKFLTHQEIAEAHKNNGIGFFPTRYETQGVSASEAAMSGLVVISGNVAAVPEVFDKDSILCNKEDFIEYANKIEELYNNPELFTNLSKKMHDNINSKYGTEIVMDAEKQMYSNISNMKTNLNIPVQEDNILLTIAIASYNVEQFLKNGVLSLLSCKLASKLEILIINDGSKDKTAEIGKQLEKLSSINGKSIVKLIDKENGGHGSAINKGIELAKGKYFKLMDGDDYFDTKELEKLITFLEKEDSDIVLTNYVEDLAEFSIKNKKYLYDFMIPGFKYNLEDLCVENYGFNEWGPLLSTSTFKTKVLKDGNFKISEKCFYVDMELNMYAFIYSHSVVYYPLNIYIYFIGRAGQSISMESYKKNYKNHEHVTLKLIEEYTKNPLISELKKVYIKSKMIIPLIKCQYMVATEFFNNNIAFRSFDKKLKNYKEFYDCISDQKFNRLTKGYFIKAIHILRAIKRRLKFIK